ncbi:MAG: tRNA (adenosine(37)-N6)-threonylcarbamoyltransferase complex ATPase subunit type 1 TsaE [Paracoccaceae bacterium]
MTAAFPITCTFSSPQATAAFAARLAPFLRPGDTLLLDGEIGTGKTHFARAIIQARLATVGRAEDVPSPTYTLVQTYTDGITDILHADLFRLTTPEDVFDLGLDDAFSEAVCIVEWPDRLAGHRPNGAILIKFETRNEPSVRVLTFHATAQRWSQLLPLFESVNTSDVAHV